MTVIHRMATLCLAVLLGGIAGAQPSPTSAVTPGELVIEPPTLINLGFEWLIDGDDNRNAKVDVSYRKAGDSAWKNGMPLLRLQGERVTQPNVFSLVSPNMFAGSILDLEPDTAYEARFVLSDPDGVRGPASNATRTVTVRTRPEPMPAAGGKVYHVYPVGYTGARTEPSFTGIMCAYNYYCGAGDTAPGGRPRVKAGDTILVHAGTYAYRYELYANQTTINATTTFEGTYYLTADGTPEQPIVIKAAGDGEVIIDGRDNFNLFNVKAADYNYFEGITFRNTGIAIWAGTQFIAGSKGLTVKRCRFEQVGMGVFSNYSGSSNFYIADSVFLGRNDSKHLIGWNGAFWEQFNGVEGQEFPPIMKSYTGIRLYGPGHVIAHNHVADFHDGIDTEMYGMPDGSHAHEGPAYPPREFRDRRPVAIDIYNNYITNAHDNSIEMDGSMHNIRLMRNVLINSASHPMSTQPSVGGPIYWIRNIVYHAPGGSTRMTAGSPGVIFYHNTVTTETSAGSSANSHWRNNLMLGQSTVPVIFSVNTLTPYSSSDYNGFRPNPGAASSFQWNVGPAPAAGAPPRPGFATLADYSKATGQDQHSVLLDYDVFVNVPKLDRDPKTVQRLYDFRNLDFQLKPGAAAIDRGLALPNVNDGFSGNAPDLGALESGKPLPIYGPRPTTVAAGDIRVMTSGAFTAPYLELSPRFERDTREKLITLTTTMGVGTASIPSRIAAGEPVDVIIVASASLDELIRDGRVVADSKVDLARSDIGMVVRAGAPKPDISTVEAFTRTLRQAKSIAYSASVSGDYLVTELVQRLGIADSVLPKSRRVVGERVGAVVARGEAEIGFQQISELLPVPGVDYVGPLPAAIQRTTIVSAGVATKAENPAAARAFIRFLASPANADVLRKSGLEPLHR